MAAKLWWLIQKDLCSECRAGRVWPAMLLMGTVVTLVFGFQMDLLPAQKGKLAGGFFWLAVFFAGTMAMDRSFASEREEGCWEALRTYPVSAAMIFLAKMAVNFVALVALEVVLVPLFVILCDVPLLARAEAMIAVAVLADLGMAAVGTLLSALANRAQGEGNLLPLLALPAVIPVVLAAANATSFVIEGDFGPAWWSWMQLLGCFAFTFIVAGTLLFEYVIEE